MTKPLPQRDVTATVAGHTPPQLTQVERRELTAVKDPKLRSLLGALLTSSRASQENFETLEQWFPVQSSDFNGITGLPFREVVWCEVNGAEGEIERGGTGMVVQRLSKGVYRVLVEEGVAFSTPSDFVTVVPRTGTHESALQAVAADAEPVTVEGIGSGWEIRLFRNVAESDPIDSYFYLLGGNFVDAAGNTIIGPRGPAGPTHKSLWHGTGAPPAELGEVDDFYVDTENFLFYGPKTEAGWGEGSSLVGPAGADGADGEPGAAGEPGKDGEQGEPGEVGLSWHGAWEKATKYKVRDAVSHNGSSYIATGTNEGQEPHS
jgi:hypothetical protein